MQLFFVNAEQLVAYGGFGDYDQAHELQRRYGLVQSLPIVLDDHGWPVPMVNEWLQWLRSEGARSPRTWDAYVRDWIAFECFLVAERGVHAIDADRDDITAYRDYCRLAVDPKLSRSSWNRHVVSLDRFFSWAVEKELIERPPFSYKTVAVRGRYRSRESVEVNLAKEKAGRRSARIRWLERDQLGFFLDVGMSGLLPDGREDPAFRGRFATRNRVFTEFLVASGLRAQEASRLLIWELPWLPATRRPLVRFPLPSKICKGSTARETAIDPVNLARVLSFVENARAPAHLAASADGRWDVSNPDATGGLINRRRVRWAQLGLGDRERLRFEGRPATLATSQRRGPMLHWDDVFVRATARCQSFDARFPPVTLHTMRHTFAVHMLRFLINYSTDRLAAELGDGRPDEYIAYRRNQDPTVVLQAFMGHESELTTRLYLSCIDTSRLFTSDDDWDDDIGD